MWVNKRCKPERWVRTRSAPRYLMSEGEKESAVQTYRRDKDYTLYVWNPWHEGRPMRKTAENDREIY